MSKQTLGNMLRNITGALAGIVLCGILVAGLWPFHAPKNQVSWLSNGDGLLFGDYGSILSSSEFNPAGLHERSCSIEIWIQPGATSDSNNIVAFSTRESPVQFAVAQSGDDLFVVHNAPDSRHRLKSSHIAIDHVFRKGRNLFITITSGSQGIAVYLNGVLAKASREFAITGNDLTGELVIANSPVQNNTWGGQFWGLGIFDRELTPTQVLQHFVAWTNHQGSELGREGIRTLYLFDEHSGSVARNQVPSQPDLYIPEHYFVLHPKFLEPFWDEFELNWTFAQDVILNIAAFIPLGFFCCAYFSITGRVRPILFTIVVGGVVSLTIETLQAYLPTRNSGMTDLITNTLGTSVGALLYSSSLVQSLLARIGLRPTDLSVADANREVEDLPDATNSAVAQ